MERQLKYAAAALATGLLLTHAAAGKAPPVLSLSAEHFTQTAAVIDEGHLTKITTQPGYVDRGVMGEVWHDEFLTATIDHDTGHVSYRIDVATTYRGASRAYAKAQYRGLEGLETVPVTVLKRQVINCPTGECTYTESLAIPVDEALLRHIAQGLNGSPALWEFRVLSKGGLDYQGALSNAEVAGLLAKVDAYLQNPVQAHTSSAPPPPPPPPAQLDFGISGLAVSPSTEAPGRAGVLVVSVGPGSVAQKAGIITGDIICEVDGRAVRSPQDLQAAIAANAVHPTARVRLYRGKETTTVEAHF